MLNDTLTLALDGEVSLGEFADTIQHLTALVSALSETIARETDIKWVVDDLAVGSTLATVRGVSSRMDLVETVVRGYAAIGQALERREPIPYSEGIRKHAEGLTKYLNGAITGVRFETGYGDSIVSSPLAAAVGPRLVFSYGQVEGIVETLTMRRSLRFVLYDLVFDHAISCYLGEGQEALMLNAWGKRVRVTGRVGREPHQGRCVVIRDVKDVKVIDSAPIGSFSEAQGILRLYKGDERPEEAIRRVRDAW